MAKREAVFICGDDLTSTFTAKFLFFFSLSFFFFFLFFFFFFFFFFMRRNIFDADRGLV